MLVSAALTFRLFAVMSTSLPEIKALTLLFVSARAILIFALTAPLKLPANAFENISSSDSAITFTSPDVLITAFSILAVVSALLLKYATPPAMLTAPIVAPIALVFALILELASTLTLPSWASTLPPEILAVVLYFISVTSTPTPAAPNPPAVVAFVIFIVSEL